MHQQGIQPHDVQDFAKAMEGLSLAKDQPIAVTKSVADALQQMEADDTGTSLEEKVEVYLTGLNRHDRRSWCARLVRKAGKTRPRFLQAKKPAEKAAKQAARQA